LLSGAPGLIPGAEEDIAALGAAADGAACILRHQEAPE
jgi:hypothetical protein